MSQPPSPINGDAIDHAIAAAAPQMARAPFMVNSPDGKGGMTSKPFAVELPTDMTEQEAFVAMGQIWNVMRQITAQAAQQKNGGLVLVKGNLPPRPG
jgi:hypothetical protein